MDFTINATEKLCYNVALSYSLACNARCAHCSVWADPRSKLKLGLNKAIECIKDAAEFGINVIALTGGEPTVYLKDLYAFMGYGREHFGMKYTMTTNSYWARTPERAREVVQCLVERGLIHIRMSADSYHQQYIPLERVVNAVEAGLACGVTTRVDVVMRRRDAESVKIWNTFKKYPVELGVQALAPKGRALDNYDEKDFPTTSLQAIRLGSCRQAGEILVHSDGYVSLCCNVERDTTGAPKNKEVSPFTLGNIHRERLATILERNERSPISRIIRYEGPYGIYKLLMHYFKDDLEIPLQARYPNPCVLCDDLLSSPELIPYIARAAERFAADYGDGLAAFTPHNSEFIQLKSAREMKYENCPS